MRTDQFKIEQMVEDLKSQRAYKQWLQALRNQKNLAKFDADFPLTESF